MDIIAILYIFGILNIISTFFYVKEDTKYKNNCINNNVNIKKFETIGIPVHYWNKDYDKIRNQRGNKRN